jgi:hypothetical protein
MKCYDDKKWILPTRQNTDHKMWHLCAEILKRIFNDETFFELLFVARIKCYMMITRTTQGE